MSNQKFSTQLNLWLTGKNPKTIDDLQAQFEGKSFAVAFLLLMSLAALPLPTGGVTHVLEIINLLLAVELIFGRKTIWLPNWAKNKSFGKMMTKNALPKFNKLIAWFEQFSRPRLSGLFGQRWFMSLLGILVFIYTLAAFLAPPFSGLDTLGGLGVVTIALSWLFEDIVLFITGIVLGSLGVAIEISLGAAAFHFII